jgi:hypothetical protein
MVAGHTMGLDRSGRELLVVVVKGTFKIPGEGEPVGLADEQSPLVMSDTFSGEPGLSAPVCEVDFAPRKLRCDVLLNGTAYAPGGRSTPRMEVGVRVNGMTKRFTVVGDRRWQAGVRGVSVSAPEPFQRMPLSYDIAFGGVDNRHTDASKHAAFMRNPIGRGFHKDLRPEWVDGTPLPNTEESDRPIEKPDADYEPMAFGPIGRGWTQRSQYAGTYDDKWLNEHCPFLPPDFDERYFQSAPVDQQTDFLRGGEDVVLFNLTPGGRVAFQLPLFNAPVHFFPRKGKREDAALTLDTLVLEPDRGSFQLVWRVTRLLRKNMFEIAQVLVGRKGRGWWQQREEITYPLVVVPLRSGPIGSDAA